MPTLKRALSRGADVRFVDIGPAFLRGAGDGDPNASYPARLQTLLRSALLHSRIVVESDGAPGETAALALTRLKAALNDPPAFVVWRTGADDALRKTPLAKFEATLRDGIGALRGSGVEMELVGPPLSAASTDNPSNTFGESVAMIAREQGVAFARRVSAPRPMMIASNNGSDGGWSNDGFASACLPEQVAKPIIEGIRATR